MWAKKSRKTLEARQKKKKKKEKEEKKNNQELQMLNNCLKLFAVQRKHDFGKKKMLQ